MSALENHKIVHLLNGKEVTKKELIKYYEKGGEEECGMNQQKPTTERATTYFQQHQAH